MKIDQAVGVMRQIADEEVVITHIHNDNLFVLRTLRSHTLLTFKTANGWTFEVTYNDQGVEYVRSAIGPDGQDRVGRWNMIPVGKLLSETEQRDLNTEIEQAIASIFPQ